MVSLEDDPKAPSRRATVVSLIQPNASISSSLPLEILQEPHWEAGDESAKIIANFENYLGQMRGLS